jgi:hypothetical protein
LHPAGRSNPEGDDFDATVVAFATQWSLCATARTRAAHADAIGANNGFRARKLTPEVTAVIVDSIVASQKL